MEQKYQLLSSDLLHQKEKGGLKDDDDRVVCDPEFTFGSTTNTDDLTVHIMGS
ncbi:hypothetical protein PZA11_000826 [Diplocarpon coronariae]